MRKSNGNTNACAASPKKYMHGKLSQALLAAAAANKQLKVYASRLIRKSNSFLRENHGNDLTSY